MCEALRINKVVYKISPYSCRVCVLREKADICKGTHTFVVSQGGNLQKKKKLKE